MKLSSLTVSGDLKYLLFVFLGIMVSILVLGYHHSPAASPQLGANQMAQRSPNAPKSVLSFNLGAMAPVSTEPYEGTGNY